MKNSNVLSWILRILVAVILVQTLYYKFTAHPDSVYIFSKLGAEPYGRIGLGIVELITSCLILIPRTKIIGIVLSFGIMCGAILAHLLVIGVQIKGDGGGLLTLAAIVFVSCAILLILHRKEIRIRA
jgi:hypothetical protein